MKPLTWWRTRFVMCRIILSLTLVMGSVLGADAKAADSAKIWGRVLRYVTEDLAVPLEGVIAVRGLNFKREVKTDQEGRYEVEVPAGVYWITAEVPLHYPYRRAPVRVRAGDEVMINIYPVWRILAIGETVTERGVEDKPIIWAPAPRYDVVRLRGKRTEPKEIWIEHAVRRRVGKEIEYELVTLSYDALTVYAGGLRYDPRGPRFIAVGTVRVEDGKQGVNAQRAEIRFRSGKPIVSLVMPVYDR